MPSPTTTEEFLELVRKSEVVEEKKLATYLEKARAAQTLPNNPAVMAGVLVRDGLLTNFQAEQFLQGRWRRFSLGKYKVLERLGAGGMGTVYLCEHKLMRRRVAVKVLPAAKADDSSSLDRFYREARAVAALDHPNIVRAYDIDQDDKLHFLVMEHVDGSSLQEIVKKTGPMDVLRACHYIRQAALGLQHAHETAGIVHRDIKPGNILVDRNGIVKVLDMGLARFFHDEEDVLTKKYDENVLGTADYLAPEQALDSHSVDIRADIYSLGATFYFCLTGRTPFAEGSVAQKLIWHQTRQPKSIRLLRPETPEGIVALIERMMAKDPAQRPQLPIELADALAPWTQTPIPPPPEHEMPQLSPAAMGGASSENVLSGASKPLSGDLSPSPKKVWQVSQSNTPAPVAGPPPKASPPSPPNDLRKTNPPPPGPLNLELSPSSSNRAPVVAPQVRTVVSPVPVESPRPTNGVVQPTAPLQATDSTDQEPSWKDLTSDVETSEELNHATSRAGRRGPISATLRVGGLPPAASSHRVGWIVAGASGAVVGLLILGGILAWFFGGKSNSQSSATGEPTVYHVNPRGGSKGYTSIFQVLSQLRGKPKQAARIIVEDDVAENDLVIDVPHVSIEAEEGKTIRWHPSAKPNASKLFMISKAEDVHIKGFTLDGENRVDFLVNLFNRCPGTRLENLKLKGFKKYGIWVTNCEGSQTPEQHIQMDRLEFITTNSQQSALFFTVEPGMRKAIPTNRFFAFHNCTFDGPGSKVTVRDLSNVADIEWPEGVEPKKSP
jgi:serine/threonine protein kinase